MAAGIPDQGGDGDEVSSSSKSSSSWVGRATGTIGNEHAESQSPALTIYYQMRLE